MDVNTVASENGVTRTRTIEQTIVRKQWLTLRTERRADGLAIQYQLSDSEGRCESSRIIGPAIPYEALGDLIALLQAEHTIVTAGRKA